MYNKEWSVNAEVLFRVSMMFSQSLLNLPGGCCICLEQSAGVSTSIAVTASFSQQTEDRAFCPVVQLLWLRASHCTDYHVTSLLILRVTCPCSLRTYIVTLKIIRSSSSSTAQAHRSSDKLAVTLSVSSAQSAASSRTSPLQLVPEAPQQLPSAHYLGDQRLNWTELNRANWIRAVEMSVSSKYVSAMLGLGLGLGLGGLRPWPKSQGQKLAGLACSRPTEFAFYF